MGLSGILGYLAEFCGCLAELAGEVQNLARKFFWHKCDELWLAKVASFEITFNIQSSGKIEVGTKTRLSS